MPTLSPELSSLPYFRGWWSDEELMSATGATSVAVIKQLQKLGVITPHKEKKESGQNARAWKPEDLFRVALAIDVSELTGLSQLAAATLLSLMKTREIDAALNTEKTLSKVQARISELLPFQSSWSKDQFANFGLKVDRPRRYTLGLVERCHVILIDHRSAAPQYKRIGELEEIRGRNPSVRKQSGNGGSIWLGAEVKDRHEIMLDRLGTAPFSEFLVTVSIRERPDGVDAGSAR